MNFKYFFYFFNEFQILATYLAFFEKIILSLLAKCYTWGILSFLLFKYYLIRLKTLSEQGIFYRTEKIYMQIREAFEDEYEFIKWQRLASYSPFAQLIPAEHWEFLKNTLLADTFKCPKARVFVAVINGAIAGSIVLFPTFSQAYEWDEKQLEYPEIRMLSVGPIQRSLGVGKALVAHCINQARIDGSPFVGLHTADYMANAMNLYKSFGFERVPASDYTPLDDGIIIKAFKLNL